MSKGIIITKDGTKEVDRPSIKYDSQLKLALENTLEFNVFKDTKTLNDRGVKFDANETNVLIEQLTHTISKVYEYWYPEFTAMMAFPMNTEGGPGLETIRWYDERWTGKARIVAKDNDNRPFVNEAVDPNTQPVRVLQLFAKYTLNELQQAARGIRPLEGIRVRNLKKGHDWASNDLAYGISDDPNRGTVTGLFSNLNQFITSADSGYATDLADFNILAQNGEDNRDSLLAVIRAPYTFTENVMARPDTLLMPIAQAARIETQPISVDNPETVAQHILRQTSITRIIGAPECKDVNGNNGEATIEDALVCYKADEEILEMFQPVPFSIYPTQLDGFNYIIPSRSEFAGLVKKKKAIALVKNCGA